MSKQAEERRKLSDIQAEVTGERYCSTCNSMRKITKGSGYVTRGGRWGPIRMWKCEGCKNKTRF
jgi:hypothetical protein